MICSRQPIASTSPASFPLHVLFPGLLALFLLPAGLTRAQESERISSEVGRILAPFDTTNMAGAARRFLIDRLERESTTWISEVLDYTDAKVGESWLDPEQRLLLQFVTREIGDREPAEIEGLLRRSRKRRPGRGDRDDLTGAIRDALRRDRPEVVRYLDRAATDSRSAEFLLLLYHSLTIRGIREVEELNRRIDDFVGLDSTDIRSEIAVDYLHREVTASLTGIGFTAGYDAGMFVPQEGIPATSVHGPRFGVLLQLGSWSLELAAHARQVELTGERLTSIEGSTLLGYDLIPGSALLRPAFGLRYGAITGESLQTTLLSPSTGLEIGTLLLFDTPPHLQLSVGAGWSVPSITETDPRFQRGFWEVRFSLSLINRSYRIE